MAQQVPSLYPTDQILNDPYYPNGSNPINFNVNEIKKYQFPDCIKSYFNYFEMWTPRLNSEERKILLNRLLQDDDVAFATYMENINEPYDVLKAKLIDQFTVYDEDFLKEKKEKRHKRKMFKKMTKDEMQEYIRTTYNQLNTQSKERLVVKELVRSLPRKFAKKLDLENKCSNVDQVIEILGEKFNNMKLKDPEKERKKMKKHHRKHSPHSNSTSSSSSSSESSSDECRKKGPHHPHFHRRPHSRRHAHGFHKH